MADGFIVRRGGKVSEKAETPTINFVSSTTTSITFTIKNNDAEDATIVYRVDSLTADGESISVAAGVTSGNQTISDLTEGDLITIFATANVEGKVKSNVAELLGGTTLATPTITQVSKTLDSITFTVRNESNLATDVTYGLTSPPTTTTLALAAETTSTNQTISGLDDDTQYTVFAQAKTANHTDSAIASSTVTTDPLPFALSFDGVDDFVNYDTQFNGSFGTNPVRFEIHIRFNNVDESQRFITQRYLLSSSSINQLIIGIQANNSLIFFTRNSSGSTTNISSGANAVQANTDYVLVFERLSNNVHRILVNGTQVASTTGTRHAWDGSNTRFNVARDNRGSSEYLDGRISFFAIDINGVRTNEYLFTEGTGTTLGDSVGNKNGTIVGATWVTL
jgi:hypothetical protein